MFVQKNVIFSLYSQFHFYYVGFFYHSLSLTKRNNHYIQQIYVFLWNKVKAQKK